MALPIIGDGGAGVRVANAGPICFNDLVGAGLTTTQLTDKTHNVNNTLISGKVKGSIVFNSTTNELVVASGSLATSTWVNAGAVAAIITPV